HVFDPREDDVGVTPNLFADGPSDQRRKPHLRGKVEFLGHQSSMMSASMMSSVGVGSSWNGCTPLSRIRASNASLVALIVPTWIVVSDVISIRLTSRHLSGALFSRKNWMAWTFPLAARLNSDSSTMPTALASESATNWAKS